jgi:hypothetical protein
LANFDLDIIIGENEENGINLAKTSCLPFSEPIVDNSSALEVENIIEVQEESNECNLKVINGNENITENDDNFLRSNDKSNENENGNGIGNVHDKIVKSCEEHLHDDTDGHCITCEIENMLKSIQYEKKRNEIIQEEIIKVAQSLNCPNPSNLDSSPSSTTDKSVVILTSPMESVAKDISTFISNAVC